MITNVSKNTKKNKRKIFMIGFDVLAMELKNIIEVDNILDFI